jgi:hypothetical protein
MRLSRVLLAILFLFGFCSNAFAQPVIELETIETGPYGPGSSIAVLFKVKGRVGTGVTYELYLSNSSGSFASPTLIGQYSGHYTTFINGVIPAAATSSANYKVQVQAKSGGSILAQATSTYSINITSNPGTSGNFIDIANLGTPIDGKWAFVSCAGSLTSITVRNKLAKPLTGIIKNEFDTTSIYASDVPRTYSIAASNQTTISPVKFVHYRLLNQITESGTGVISTQAWFLSTIKQ